MTSIAPAMPNTSALCSESQTICGTADTNVDSAAPAPMVTSSTGKAQQISVPLDVKMLKIDAAFVLRHCERSVESS